MDKATKTKAWKELTKPFAKSVIKKSPKGFGDFVPHHIYTRRLVDSGLLKSFDTVEVIRGAEGHVISARCTLVVDSPEGEKTVTSCGDVEPSAINMFKNGKKSEGELIKDAESDAIKRCCMRLGIGLHLWEQDMSEEEYSASVSVDSKPTPKPEVKVEKKPAAKLSKEEVKKMEDIASEMVSDDVKKSPVAEQLNHSLEVMIPDENQRDSLKKRAYNELVNMNVADKDITKWTADNMSTFLTRVEDYLKEDTSEPETTKDIVEEVFGEVTDKSEKVCPECQNSGYIKDNRVAKEEAPDKVEKNGVMVDNKFKNFPDFNCQKNDQYNPDFNGCGKGWYTNNAPTEWL